MKRGLLWLAMVCVFCGAGTGWGITYTPETYTDTQPVVDPQRTVIVGVTLGNGWAGFPDKLMPSYEVPNTGDAVFRLDHELPLYVNWIIDYDHTTETGTPQHLDSPVAITSYSWFNGHHGEFWADYVYVAGQNNDVGYHACAQGHGLEAPMEGDSQSGPFPLTSDGKLRVNDVHGGIMTTCRIHLKRFADDQRESYNIILGWDHPGPWWDIYLDEGRELTPGMIRTDQITVYHGGVPVQSWYDSRIVAWASADFGVPFSLSTGPSPRDTDSSDLALFSTMFGQTVRYGLNTEDPPNDPTWHCNVVSCGNDGATIDATDLALFVYWLEHDNSCTLSKAGSDEASAILAWFGIAATERTLNVAGMSLPEYEIVDLEKNQRAIADPYGYRSLINSESAKETSWGLVKERYR